MFLLFTYEGYYPSGAALDFAGKYETLREAFDAGMASKNEFTDVLDLDTMQWTSISNTTLEYVGGIISPESVDAYRNFPYDMPAVFYSYASTEINIKGLEIDFILTASNNTKICSILASDGAELVNVEQDADGRQYAITIDGKSTHYSKIGILSISSTGFACMDKVFELSSEADTLHLHQHHSARVMLNKNSGTAL